jgi:hypothetical protein
MKRKRFNIAGNCIESENYMIPTKQRIREVYDLVEEGSYFTIYSSRQSGKTTAVKDLVNSINKKKELYAIYCSLEVAQGISDLDQAINSILNTIKLSFIFSGIFDNKAFDDIDEINDSSNLILYSLSKISAKLDKKLVLIFDEADCLEYNVLISFLRQIRSGYINRDQFPFVYSIGLVGMRKLKDYKADIRPNSDSAGTSSPFNIAAGHYTLANFTLSQIAELYNQHSIETGQIFEQKAIEKAFFYSQGHPWLVNAIAKEAVEKIHKLNYNKYITEEDIVKAANNLILRRDTHFDSLLERLKEKRVKSIIEKLIIGDYISDYISDDFQFCMDLGILKNQKGVISPANPMYQEIILRELSFNDQNKLSANLINKWISNNSIDMNSLLKEFQNFWRENSEIWVEKYQYKEAAPHLILQAFLQRVVNGGAKISREYATGTKRLDLCIEFANKKYPIELKLLYSEKTKQEGIYQLSEYMDKMNEKTGWLVIFDRKSNKDWNDKIYWESIEQQNKTIHIVGL